MKTNLCITYINKYHKVNIENFRYITKRFLFSLSQVFLLKYFYLVKS